MEWKVEEGARHKRIIYSTLNINNILDGQSYGQCPAPLKREPFGEPSFLNLFKWFCEIFEIYPSLNRVSKVIDNGLRGVCLKGINNITISRLLLERIASLNIFFRFISKWLSKMFQEIV
jgi:hypothetical protein